MHHETCLDVCDIREIEAFYQDFKLDGNVKFVEELIDKLQQTFSIEPGSIEVKMRIVPWITIILRGLHIYVI